MRLSHPPSPRALRHYARRRAIACSCDACVASRTKRRSHKATQASQLQVLNLPQYRAREPRYNGTPPVRLKLNVATARFRRTSLAAIFVAVIATAAPARGAEAG